MKNNSSLSYILNHLGEDRENYKYAVAPPLFQNSNFTFDSIAHMREALKDELNQPFYTRGCNPTVTTLRQKLAALEGSDDALLFGSGSAAIAAAVMHCLKAGDHAICVLKPYSWTKHLLQSILSQYQVAHTFVDATQLSEIEAAILPNTKLIFTESPNSMTFELQDLEAIATLARSKGIKTICDNSYCTALLQKPIEMGIDIVVYSSTKYYAGHSNLVAGILCASHEIVRSIFQNEYMTLGGILSPHDAWLMLRSLRTLPIRLKAICEHTQIVIDRIQNHPRIKQLIWPLHDSFPQKTLAQKQMKNATGLFTLILNCEKVKSVDTFCDCLSMFLPACSWGGYESLVFPMSVLYDSENYSNTTLPFQLVRFSIGLEEPELLAADILQALDAIVE